MPQKKWVLWTYIILVCLFVSGCVAATPALYPVAKATEFIPNAYKPYTSAPFWIKSDGGLYLIARQVPVKTQAELPKDRKEVMFPSLLSVRVDDSRPAKSSLVKINIRKNSRGNRIILNPSVVKKWDSGEVDTELPDGMAKEIKESGEALFSDNVSSLPYCFDAPGKKIYSPDKTRYAQLLLEDYRENLVIYDALGRPVQKFDAERLKERLGCQGPQVYAAPLPGAGNAISSQLSVSFSHDNLKLAVWALNQLLVIDLDSGVKSKPISMVDL